MTGYDGIRTWLRQRRLDLGWSQQHTATRAGVSETTLANWENENAEPTGPNLIAWIHSLDCNVYVSNVDPRRQAYTAAIEALADTGRHLVATEPWEAL